MSFPERPYHITWTWTAETTKEYASGECCSITGVCEPSWDVNVEQLLETTRNEITAACFNELQNKAAEKGFSFAVTRIEPYAEWVTRSERRQYRDYTCIRKFAKLKCGAIVEFDSDVKVDADEPHFSPLIWWQWCIAAFLTFIVAIYGVGRLFDLLDSMVTKTTTVKTTYKYHCTEELAATTGCEYCTDVEKTTEETIKEPDYGGIFMVLTAMVVTVGVAVAAPVIVRSVSDFIERRAGVA